MELDTAPLGWTGLAVSERVVGTWRFGRCTAEGILETDCETAGAAEVLL